VIPPLLVHVGQVTSTNDVVRDAILAGAPSGYAVYADDQTGGRGRLGRRWFTAAGGSLPLSIALAGGELRPVLTLLPLAAAVATARVLREKAGVTAGIKWPNDLLVDGRKLAGILCEGVVDRAGIRGVVVGIGVNVNLDPGEAPEELRGRITSLAALTGRLHEVEALAAALRLAVVDEVAELSTGSEAMLARWREGSVTLGRQVVAGEGEARVEGEAVDVAGDGGLVVRCGDGVLRIVRSGEIAMLGADA
jgi:BirA family biotin operon repressor/biotin-[acetyl-CoA-carboxylase] ligase